MRSPALRFMLYALLLAAMCALAETVWNANMPALLTMRHGYQLLALFTIVVTGVHLFMLRAAQGSPSSFVRFFMAGTALKMLAFMLILIVYLLFSEESKKALILHFLFYYAAFTLLEVSMLYRELNKPR